MTQPEFIFNRALPLNGDNALVRYLEDAHAAIGIRWIRAKNVTGMSERVARDWAEASDGLVISGNKGYCLLCLATADEVKESAARLISQGKRMVKRGIRQLRRMHAMEVR